MLKFVTPILKIFQFSLSIFTIKSILSLDLMFHLIFNKIMKMEMKHTLKDYCEKCKIFKIKSILMSTNHPLILILECCTLRYFSQTKFSYKTNCSFRQQLYLIK